MSVPASPETLIEPTHIRPSHFKLLPSARHKHVIGTARGTAGVGLAAPHAHPVFPKHPSAEMDRRDMHGVLTALGSDIRQSYAQSPWKSADAHWDLDTELSHARARIDAMQPPTRRGFQEIVRDLFVSMRDQHVSVTFDGQKSMSLPITVLPVGDVMMIASIDASRLPKGTNLKVGDIIKRYDGRDMNDVMRDLLITHNAGNSGAALHDAAEALTYRAEASLDDLPTQPTATIEVESLAGVKRPPVTLAWKEGAGAPDKFDRDSKRGFVPQLGPYTAGPFNGKYFYSYAYRDPQGHNVAFIRIPTFDYNDNDKYVAAVKEFTALIKRYRGTTDGMVLDLTNNSGGSVRYAYALLAALAHEGLIPQTDRFKLTQKVVQEARDRIAVLEKVKTEAQARALDDNDDNEGLPMTLELVQKELAQQREVVKADGDLYTEPMYSYGIDRMPKRSITYDKPMVALVNEWCVSSCDMAAAMLQDAGRAVIVGTRTAGAGGDVEQFSVPNRFGIKSFSLTVTYSERADHDTPIENLGVEPDVKLPITGVDLERGFTAYAKAVNNEIAKEIARKKAEKRSAAAAR